MKNKKLKSPHLSFLKAVANDIEKTEKKQEQMSKEFSKEWNRWGVNSDRKEPTNKS